MKTQDTAMQYEIRIKGYLSTDDALWVNNFETGYTPDGDTILRGTILDQSELHGILMKIRDLVLTLLQVRQTEGEQ